MTVLQHRTRYRWVAPVAIAATLLFVAVPFLLIHHHHDDGQASTCALCIFASSALTGPPAAPVIACPSTVVAIVPPLREAVPTVPASKFRQPRAPPTV